MNDMILLNTISDFTNQSYALIGCELLLILFLLIFSITIWQKHYIITTFLISMAIIGLIITIQYTPRCIKQYQVLLEDDINWVEFLNKYSIIKTEGRIVTIEEK